MNESEPMLPAVPDELRAAMSQSQPAKPEMAPNPVPVPLIWHEGMPEDHAGDVSVFATLSSRAQQHFTTWTKMRSNHALVRVILFFIFMATPWSLLFKCSYFVVGEDFGFGLVRFLATGIAAFVVTWPIHFAFVPLSASEMKRRAIKDGIGDVHDELSGVEKFFKILNKFKSWRNGGKPYMFKLDVYSSISDVTLRVNEMMLWLARDSRHNPKRSQSKDDEGKMIELHRLQPKLVLHPNKYHFLVRYQDRQDDVIYVKALQHVVAQNAAAVKVAEVPVS